MGTVRGWWQGRERFERRNLGSLLADLHYQLRSPGDSPVRTGLAVWLGTVIGFLPVYGLHLVLCAGLARYFRLSGLTAYLAAHVNNPLTAPVLLYFSLGTGHWLTTGSWASIRIVELEAAGPLALGADLLLGSLALGLLSGGVLGGVAYAIRRRWSNSRDEERLTAQTARRYLQTGIFNWEFVGAKLRYDPLYLGLVKSSLLAGRSRLLDLGCGRGILLALVAEAGRLASSEAWPESWGRPLGQPDLIGVESSEKRAAVATVALGDEARVIHSDLTIFRPGPADSILLLDVLHYLSAADQQLVLSTAAESLEAGGVLILREAAADGGVRFLLTRCAERLCAMVRRDWRQRFCYRSVAEWEGLLSDYGLVPESTPMSRGTPYANFLILARKPIGVESQALGGAR
jgi:uncharacterized protein (DUF2062 family)